MFKIRIRAKWEGNGGSWKFLEYPQYKFFRLFEWWTDLGLNWNLNFLNFSKTDEDSHCESHPGDDYDKDYKSRIYNALIDGTSKLKCTFYKSSSLNIGTLPEIKVSGMDDLLAFPLCAYQAGKLKEVSNVAIN